MFDVIYGENKIKEKVSYFCSLDINSFIMLVNKYNKEYPLNSSLETTEFVRTYLNTEQNKMARWWANYQSRNGASQSILKLKPDEYICCYLASIDEFKSYTSVAGRPLFEATREVEGEGRYSIRYYDLTSEGRIFCQMQYAFSSAFVILQNKYRKLNFGSLCYYPSNWQSIIEEGGLWL